MSIPLVVIEAPGKISSLRKILDQLGLNMNVTATYGRIYDLPKDRLGIDADFQLEQVPLDLQRCELLKRKLDAASKLFILTDDDHEGEVIASHVAKLSGKPDCVRLRVGSLTKSAIEKAFQNPDQIDMSRVMGGTNRRVFDRLCGYVLSDNGGVEHGQRPLLGRIASPLLNHINKTKVPPQGEFSFPLKSSVGLILASGAISHNSGFDISTLESTLRGGTGFVFNESSRRSYKEMGKPLTALDAAITFSARTDRSVSACMDSMQRLYEKGLISYPRTESSELTSHAKQTISRIAFDRGEAVEHSDFSLLKDVSNGLAHHDALHVTSLMNVGLCDFSNLPLDEQIWVLIFRNNVSCIQEYVVEEKKYHPESRVLQDLINTPGLNIEFKSVVAYGAGGRRFSHYDPQAGLCPELARGWSSSPSRERLVAQCLREIGLGRPSTISYHSNKVSKGYLKLDGSLNHLGVLSIARAKDVAPMILSVEKAHRIDNILLEGGDMRATMIAAFREADIRNEYFFAKPRDGIVGDLRQQNTISME